MLSIFTLKAPPKPKAMDQKRVPHTRHLFMSAILSSLCLGQTLLGSKLDVTLHFLISLQIIPFEPGVL